MLNLCVMVLVEPETIEPYTGNYPLTVIEKDLYYCWASVIGVEWVEETKILVILENTGNIRNQRRHILDADTRLWCAKFRGSVEYVVGYKSPEDTYKSDVRELLNNR